jgi:hypothetical protein
VVLRAGAAFVLTCTLYVASACEVPLPEPASSAKVSSTPSGTPLAPAQGNLSAEVPMPVGFPSDFPIYPGARLTQAGNFASDGATSWGMGWQTLASPSKVQLFYVGKLDTGDWRVISHSGTATATTAYSATFRRRSDGRITGTLGVAFSGGVTKISLVLSTPY